MVSLKKGTKVHLCHETRLKKKALAGDLKVSHGVHIFYQVYIISLFYEPDIETKSNIKIKKHPKAWQ